MILLPLHPASLAHTFQNPQRRKILMQGMHPIGRKDQTDRSISTCVVEESHSCNFNSVAVIKAVV